MSGIFDPGVGDKLDRLIILQRKLQAEKREHWEQETVALLDTLPATYTKAQVVAVIKLAIVNMIVWQETDDQALAARLYQHNRARHALVEELNADGKGEKL